MNWLPWYNWNTVDNSMKPRSITFIKLLFSWIPTCAKIFVDDAEHWQSLVGPNDNDSTELVQEFFSSVAAIMSRQLRGMVINSLQDFLSFFEIHKVGIIYFVTPFHITDEFRPICSKKLEENWEIALKKQCFLFWQCFRLLKPCCHLMDFLS